MYPIVNASGICIRAQGYLVNSPGIARGKDARERNRSTAVLLFVTLFSNFKFVALVFYAPMMRAVLYKQCAACTNELWGRGPVRAPPRLERGNSTESGAVGYNPYSCT